MNEQWTQLVLGAWIIISPWLFGFADVSFAKWSNVIVGLVLVIMNAWIIFNEKNLQQSVEVKNKQQLTANH